MSHAGARSDNGGGRDSGAAPSGNVRGDLVDGAVHHPEIAAADVGPAAEQKVVLHSSIIYKGDAADTVH